MAKKCFNGNVKSSSFYNCEWTLITEAHVWKPARRERQTLLPGPRPLQTWPVSHCAVLCFWRGVHPPTITPNAGLLPSTSENLNHHWSRSPSVGRVLGNRKNEQRFPNLPLHLFWPSVGGVIKKNCTVNHTCMNGSFRLGLPEHLRYRRKSCNTVNEKELLALLFPTKLHKNEQNIK